MVNFVRFSARWLVVLSAGFSLFLAVSMAKADVGQPDSAIDSSAASETYANHEEGTTLDAPQDDTPHAASRGTASASGVGATAEGRTDAEFEVSSSTGRPATQLFFTSFLTGPPVTNPASNETAAYIDGNTLGLSLENQVGFRYYLSKEFTISPVFDFEWQFTDPHHVNGQDKRLALTYDSFVKLYRSNVITADLADNAFTIDLEGRIYVPTSEFSRTNESLGSVRLSVNPGLEIGRTGLSLFMVNFVRYWVQTRTYEGGRTRTTISLANRSHTLPEWTFYTGPQVSYRVNDKITAWVLYETSRTVDTLGISNTSNPKASLADVEPGVDIRINDNIVISPYLNWYTKQPLDTTSINVTAGITI